MRGVNDNGISGVFQVRDGFQVNHKIIIAERKTPLGQEYLIIALVLVRIARLEFMERLTKRWRFFFLSFFWAFLCLNN